MLGDVSDVAAGRDADARTGPRRRQPHRPPGDAREHEGASHPVSSPVFARVVPAQRLAVFVHPFLWRQQIEISMKPSPITLRKDCRVCGSKKLRPILSLGEQYAVGFLDRADETAGKGPLDLVL